MTRMAVELRHSGEREPVPIASDAAMMSHGIADGKLLPLLILDTRSRADVDEVVFAHQDPNASGDVTTAWLLQSWRNRGELRVMLQFIQPVACLVFVAFELQKYAGVVDQIVQNEAMYIQPGRPGDRLKNTLDAPRMLVEIDCEQFRADWDRIFSREAAKKLRRGGMSRRSAKEATPKYIREWREFTMRRMGEYGESDLDETLGDQLS